MRLLGMGIAHEVWQVTPNWIRTLEWRRHERSLRRRWGDEQRAKRYVAEHGLVVTGGPFLGMRFPQEAVKWEQPSVVPLLRGTYEREIQPYLRPAPVFVDIGSAYGCYLVGMARLGARAYGFEIAPTRRRDSRRLARLNGVADRVVVSGALKAQDLAGVDLAGALVLCDIEGAESDLIPEHAEAFAGSRLIVEFHHKSQHRVIPALESTHTVTLVPFEGRDDLETELRDADQSWGVFEPRSATGVAAHLGVDVEPGA